MFNEKQKREFLDQEINENQRQPVEVLFNKVEEYENTFGKDISEMDYDKAKVSLVGTGGMSVKSISWQLSMLKKYVNWCITNYKTQFTENVFDIIQVNEINNSFIITTQMIRSPDHLQETLDVVYTNKEIDSSENVMRMRFWLIYNGVSVEELTYLKKKEVDIKNGTIKLKDRDIEMMAETKRLLEIVSHMEYYSVVVSGKNVLKPVVQTEYMAMNYDTPTDQTRLSLIQMFSKFSNKYRAKTGQEFKLSPSRVLESGFFYRWYQGELNLKSPNFEEYAKFKTSTNKAIYYTRILKEISIEYSSWKKAFNLV